MKRKVRWESHEGVVCAIKRVSLSGEQIICWQFVRQVKWSKIFDAQADVVGTSAIVPGALHGRCAPAITSEYRQRADECQVAYSEGRRMSDMPDMVDYPHFEGGEQAPAGGRWVQNGSA